ncbi:MAG: hemerythrin family protein [Candidatus Gastranaerophilales bacterium]|nr:hemerythrin family protein [Candidatus Gastranaerophilales bacterium]
MIQWSERLKLGIDILDEQHKELFVVTNRLLEAFKKNNAQDQAYEAICFLEEYVIKHFRAEEFYFSKLPYPDKDNHIRLHKEFQRKIEDFKNRHFKTGITPVAAKEISSYLLDWWVYHIENVDRKYADLQARIRYR